MFLKFSSILITCEHAGNEVPENYQSLFNEAEEILQSHRGWDPGAIEMARCIATKRNLPLFHCDVTRLLIEANRSIDNPQLFSSYSQSLSEELKEILKQRYYFPYRKAVESHIQSLSKPALHLSIHTFTPVLNGVKRNTDIGLLFDPSRALESECCAHFREKLSIALPTYQIDFNKPYLGTDDGFTTYLRTKLQNEDYAGIEIEVNQKFISESDKARISFALNEALTELLT